MAVELRKNNRFAIMVNGEFVVFHCCTYGPSNLPNEVVVLAAWITGHQLSPNAS
jgi:hypothetical protein